MSLKVGLENNMEGRSLAWALEHPGCFAYGSGPLSALHAMPIAFQTYRHWISTHTSAGNWLEGEYGEPEVAEIWKVYTIDDSLEINPDGDYEVNSWFLHDWKPLAEKEIQRAQMMLEWSRSDLLGSITGLDSSSLHASHPGERWSISSILTHVAAAEWWYLDRLNLVSPREQVSKESMTALKMVRSCLLAVLPDLEGSTLVIGRHGELWSPRKLLRRSLWHERDHTAHILKLR